MKSGGFHHEIQWISWNPADFRWKSGRFHVKSTQNLINSDVSAKNSSVWVDFMVKSAGFQVKSKDLLQGIVTLCLHVWSEKHRVRYNYRYHVFWLFMYQRGYFTHLTFLTQLRKSFKQITWTRLCTFWNMEFCVHKWDWHICSLP